MPLEDYTGTSVTTTSSRRTAMKRRNTLLPTKMNILKLQDFIDYSVFNYDELGRVLSKALKNPNVNQPKKRTV